MKDILTCIYEANYDSFGSELNTGDHVIYKTSKITIIGEITDITDTKYIVKPVGWYGDESKKSLLKQQYKVNLDSKNIFKATLKKRDEK